MENNLELWNKLKTPPPSVLKKISGGRLKGMTDISPSWRYQVLTEQFGPCGIGWKFTIDELWTAPGSDDQVAAFARISLYVMKELLWSDPIPGIGGSMLITKETNGMHTSDEAYKMAVTDALSTACKMLGVAADIYMGLWDGSKYKEGPQKKADPEKYDEWVEAFNRATADKIPGLTKFWKDHGATIKKECSAANAAKIYKMLTDAKKDMAAPEPGSSTE